jgi:putative ABC transport system ATP-binding protein
MGSVLRAECICKNYTLDGVEVAALTDASLDIHEGEFVAIIGQSGSGKSTLMHIIGLLDRPSSGRVVLEGEETASLAPNKLSDLRNRRIGFVFQSFNLLAKTSALANVELPLVYAGVGGAERTRRAKEALERVGLGGRLGHHPNQLSGGQQQRVAIARALVNQPSIVLADEPTGNLDSKSGIEVMTMLQELHEQGITIVLVTHDARVARHAERIVQILDGRVVGDEIVTDRIMARDAVAAQTDREEVAA